MADSKEIRLEDFPSRCQERQSVIVSKDERNPQKHIARNSDAARVRHYKIDGDVCPKGEQPRKCDFLLLNDDKKHAYLIELKGSIADWKDAKEQTESTKMLLRSSLKGYTCFYRFVFGRGHGKTAGPYMSGFIAWREREKKHDGKNIVEWKPMQLEETI